MNTIPRALVLAILAVVGPAASAATGTGSWWLNLRTTGYAYQSFDAAGAASDHLEGFQHVSGAVTGLAGGRAVLRLSARVADDVRYEQEAVQSSRLHAAQLVLRPVPRLRIETGRLFVHEGVASLTLDGVRATWRQGSRWQAIVWGGGRAPYDHAFDLADLEQDVVRGARFVSRPAPGVRLGLSTAYRERGGAVAERPVGFDGVVSTRDGVQVAGRADYDLELETWRRLEGRFRWRAPGNMPEVRLQMLSRRPSIDAASWFSRFVSAERIGLMRLNLRHEGPDGVGAELEYLGTFVDDRASSRVGIAALMPFGRLGWSLRLGEAGDESGLYGDLGADLNGWLRAEAAASFLTYTLLNDDPLAEQRVIMTLGGRLRADVRPGLQLTAEVQRLETPEHAHDVRLLLGVNLAAGGGTSRFGLADGEVRP